MGVPVKSLLRTMLIKRGMAEDGTTRPDIVAVNLFRTLVDRLQELDSDEEIEINVVSSEPLFAQYIRSKTGEILAEISMTDYRYLSQPD